MLANGARSIMIVILVNRACVFVLHTVYQRTILVATAVAGRRLGFGVHAQIVGTTTLVCVVFFRNEPVVKLFGAGRACTRPPACEDRAASDWIMGLCAK